MGRPNLPISQGCVSVPASAPGWRLFTAMDPVYRDPGWVLRGNIVRDASITMILQRDRARLSDVKLDQTEVVQSCQLHQ